MLAKTRFCWALATSSCTLATIPSALADVVPMGEPMEITISPTLSQLVELSAQQLGVDIEFTPADLSKKLTLRSVGGYEPEELWELTHRMLEAAGTTTVLAPGQRRLYRVVRIAQAAESTAVLDDIPHPEPGYAILLYPLAAADPVVVAAAINDARPPIGSASVAPGGAGVQVGALTRRRGEIAALVGSLDRDAATTTQRVVPLEHADSTTLVASVNAAKEQLPGRKLRGTLALGPRPGAVVLTAPESDADQIGRAHV